MNLIKSHLSLVFLFILVIESNFVSKAEDEGKSAWGLNLPNPITSFGACKEGKFLYVYGGHVGDAHVISHQSSV